MPLYGQADYLNGHGSAAELLGMNAANQSRAAGASTPPTTAAGGDRQMVPWHPDSPSFWFAAIAIATVLGALAADVKVRVGRRRFQAGAGQT